MRVSRYQELEAKYEGDTYYTELYIDQAYNTKYLYFYRNDDMIKEIELPVAVMRSFDIQSGKYYSAFLTAKENGYDV